MPLPFLSWYVLQRLTPAPRTGGSIFLSYISICANVSYMGLRCYIWLLRSLAHNTHNQSNLTTYAVFVLHNQRRTIRFFSATEESSLLVTKSNMARRSTVISNFWRRHAGKTAVHYDWYTLIFIYATIRLNSTLQLTQNVHFFTDNGFKICPDYRSRVRGTYHVHTTVCDRHNMLKPAKNENITGSLAKKQNFNPQQGQADSLFSRKSCTSLGPTKPLILFVPRDLSPRLKHETDHLPPYSAQDRAGEPFWRRVPKLSINFEELLSCAHGNFEKQNKVLESSNIIINYSIINNINVHYNYIINA